MSFRPNFLHIGLAGLILILMGWVISAAPAAGNEICFTKTVFGENIEPPMCFVPETISPMKIEQCTYYPAAGGGKICSFRPEPPKPRLY